MADIDAVFEDVGEIDLRDEKNREFQRIADRLSCYARDSYNKPIFVGIYADPEGVTQVVNVSVELPVEVIKDL